jgi:hypothetical protein
VNRPRKGQLFRKSANSIARLVLFGFPVLIAGSAAAVFAFARSDFWTGVETPQEQPVPFSHKHHVGGLGIDCRYCHTSVEESAFAGLPPTETCMTCHSQVWKDAPVLQPVRESWQTGMPIKWQRVHDLPDYVYFNHSIHIAKGVGCASCHGAIDRMPLTYKAKPLTMGFCLDCHRNPGPSLRPRSAIYDTEWRRSANTPSVGSLMALYHVPDRNLTDCSLCHR